MPLLQPQAFDEIYRAESEFPPMSQRKTNSFLDLIPDSWEGFLSFPFVLSFFLLLCLFYNYLCHLSGVVGILSAVSPLC